MWGYHRVLLFLGNILIQKIGILIVVFCGLFSNIIFADSVNSDWNHISKKTLATSFTTNPVAVGGTITVCQGQSISYTNTSTGVGSNPTYAWSFPGGNITSSTLASPPTIIYNTAGTYISTLTINGFSSSVSVVVLNISPSTIDIQLVDGNFWGTSIFNGNQYFTYCSSDANTNGGLFSFITNSTNTTSTTQHIFNWGDGQNNTYIGSNLPETFHFYQNSGTFTLTYTIINSSGCSTVKNFNIYVGASPTATINPGGIPVLCNPGSIVFNILAGAQNSPNTIYTFQVNDGSPAVTFNHPPPTSYTHNYTITSCGTVSTINGTLYPNSFQASITVSNPCGTTSSAFGPINIQTTPDANFTRTPNGDSICKGTTVIFNNTTTGGSNIGGAPSYTCTNNYKKYWTISGPSGNIPVTSSGLLIPNTFISVIENLGFNNGQPNNSGAWLPSVANQLNITFNTPGTYTITLYTGSNTCGITSETQTICVNPEVIADFTSSTTTGCVPTNLTLDNLSSLPGCSNTNVYTWQVTHTNPENCPNASSSGWSFTTGTSSSFEPEITFTSAGIYTLQLTTSLQNAIAGTLCLPDIKTQTITIKDKPRTTLTSQTICEGTTLTLNPTVYNCYANQAVTYLWDFGSNPPTSISSTTSGSPIVTFNIAGTYNYTLTLTNECGSNTFSSSVIVNPAVQIIASGPTATCLNTGIPLTGSITGGATTGTWTASITGGTFLPNATTLSPTYTPPVNYSGTITFTLTSADPDGPCPAKTISFPVVVNGQATAEAGTYNPVCQNGSLQLNGTIGGAASSGSWTSSNGGSFSDTTSLTSTYSPPAGFTGTIVLTLTTNDPPGPCNPELDTVTIIVIPTPTINTISNVVVCQDESVGPITFSGTSATNYTWTNSNPAIGLLATGTSAISFIGTNTTTTPITGTITVTPFNTSGATSCPGTPTTFTITINPKGQVNTIPGQVVCNGDSVAIANFSTNNIGGTTTYAWTSSNTAIGLTSPGNGDVPIFTATNTTTSPISSIITVTPTFSNGGVICAGPTMSITITVNPTGEVNQPNNVVFCAGAASTAIPFTTSNTIGTTSYTWTNDTLGIGLNASGTGNIPVFTPINNTTSPIVATISVIPTFSNGGKSCIGPSKVFTITINPRGQVNNVSNIIVCNGETVPALSFTTNNTGGTTIFNWVNNTPSIGLIGSGTDTMPSFLAVNNGTIPITASITVTPQYTNSITCNGSPLTYTIIVNPSAKATTVTNKTVCNGSTLAAINFTTSNIGGSTSYSWTNDTPSIGLGASGNGNITAFTAVNLGTSPIVATIQVTPSYTNNGITCFGSSTSFTITVNPTAQVNTIANQILCNGSTTSAVIFTTNNTGGTTTYSWTNSNPAIGLALSGTGNINAFNVTNNTASPISGTINVTPYFSNETTACTSSTQSFTITVNPSPVVSFSPTNQTICSGNSSALVTLSSTTSGATLTWTAVQPTGITGVTISGTNTIPAQTLVNTTNTPITITYAAVAVTNDVYACAGIANNYTITVIPRPSITESFTDAICNSGTFSIIPTNSTLNSIPSGTTYSWNVPVVTGGITGGASGINQTTIAGTLINPTNTVQTATYTVTPIFNNCPGTAFAVVISVNPKPAIASVTLADICSESAFFVTPSNGSGNIVPSNTTYTWTISTNTNITGASPSTSAGISTISQTLINTSNIAQTIIYSVTPTSGDSGNCMGSNFTITVIVNPKPSILATNPTICSGTAFSVTPIHGSGNNVPNATTYTWTTPISNPAGAITGGTDQTIGIATISQILNNTTNAAATLEYTITPTSGTCSGTPFTIIVTVNPTPTTLGLTNQNYCNAVPTNEIVLNNGVSGTTYAWTNSNTAIGLAASGTGNIPVFTTTNNGTAPIIATISIIASANNCSRVAETYTITVNPSPAVSFSPTNQTICSGDSSALVTLSSTTSSSTFTWTAVQPTGITGVITSGTNTIPAQTLVNTTNTPITITYLAVAVTNDVSACAGIAYNYTITVNPKPAIENQVFVICSEQGFTVALVNGTPNASTIVPVGTSYTWTINTNSNITGANAGTGSQISEVLTNTSTTIQTIIYTVTPTAGTCIGTPFTITVEVYPKPDVQFDFANQTICNNTTSNLVTLSSSLPGAITFAWTANIPTGISGATASGTGNIPLQTLVNSTNAPLTITYSASATFTSNGNSCTGNNTFYTITVNPTFIASGVLSNYSSYNVSVFGGNDGTINLTVAGGSGTYTYSWVGPNGFTATAEDLTGLIAGIYTVTINDGYCVPIVLTFTLTQPPELLVQQDLALNINLLCFGNSNGAVGIQITQESVGPYDYTLLNSTNVIVQTITNSTNLNPQFTGLVAGTYSILVTDANGGTKTVTGLVVSQPDDIVISPTITEITCYGANNATISLTITGGTGPYVANWNNLATGLFQNNLAAGSYTVTITDANGCTKPSTINIIEAPIFTINPIISNISCFGANDGSINLNLIGGQAPVTLTWNDGSTSGTVRNNLLPGTYSVSISDGKPCYINRTFIIVEPQPLVLNAIVQNALNCFNASSGAINLVVSGGTPPFTYNWSNSVTSEDLSNIPNGNYSVVVTDSRGCIKSASYTVSRPLPLLLVLDQDSQVNCTTGTITNVFKANVSGGMPPFSINWSSGTISGTNNEFMFTTQNGLITVTITDANGCSTSQSVTITNPILGNAGFTQNSYAYTTFGMYSMLDPIQFTNTATGEYISVSWNFGDGTFSTDENPIHTYVLEGNYIVTQTVTYPLGCIKTTTISLIIEKGYVLVVPTAFTPNNDSLNDTFRPVTKGLKNVRLDIYDTWGSLIYSESGDVISGWNGQIKDTPAENGNYYSKVSAETFYGTIVNENQTFVLIK